MEVGLSCRSTVAVEDEVLGGSMSQISILDGCFVDSFAGGGGASTGIKMSTGHPVDDDAIRAWNKESRQ